MWKDEQHGEEMTKKNREFMALCDMINNHPFEVLALLTPEDK